MSQKSKTIEGVLNIVWSDEDSDVYEIQGAHPNDAWTDETINHFIEEFLGKKVKITIEEIL